MNSVVSIRGSKHGISVKLAESATYEEIKQNTASAFRDAAKLLGDKKVAVSFEGKVLTEEQQEELVELIHQNSSLQIICIMEQASEKDRRFQESVLCAQMELDASTGEFYKGHIRSGQVAEFERSVIIIGDVNPGASIVSKGNIIILGSLKGTAFAGASGKRNCFIVAMDMQPIQIRIADVFARSADRPEDKVTEPRIAFVEDENIYIEPLTKSVLNDITL
ncbi:MAG: septum site-determining protein MinC [Lachnospiraceae bacterium]|nr:septum site-determining protein MinC [Lachnospiraceae bacterium]